MKALYLAVSILFPSNVTLADSASGSKPDHWLATALIGAILATAGYFGKAVHNRIKASGKAKRNSKSEMEKLSTLLEESGSLFRDQNYKARRLMKRLESRLGNEVPSGLGFDETFYRLYSRLDREELELHSLIRSTTMNSLKRVNSSMSEWLDRNLNFRRTDTSSTDREQLAAELSTLRLHLNQWHDKFAAHMPDEKRCLVYLADEKQHGAGFPQNLEPVLRRVLGTA